MDTVLGLPVHPLVVHGVVVLVPLAAVVTVVVTARRSWRERLAWVVVVLNAGVLGLTVAARQSGLALQERLQGIDIGDHGDWGDRLPLLAAALLASSVLAAVLRRARVGPLLVVLTVVVAAGTVYWTLRTGHSGAVAVWGNVVQ